MVSYSLTHLLYVSTNITLTLYYFYQGHLKS